MEFFHFLPQPRTNQPLPLLDQAINIHQSIPSPSWLSMSQHIIPIYKAIDFGHPHDASEAQITEPFWFQYPPWTDLGKYDHYHHPALPNNYRSYKMDPPTVVIGSNTKNGRKIQQATVIAKPRVKVDVYAEDVFIEQIPFGLLMRFSSVAQKAFPRPTKSVAKEGVEARAVETKKDTKDAKPDWADEEADKVDVQKLTAEFEKANLAKSSELATGTVATTNESGKKSLQLFLHGVYEQPPPEAYKFVFQWMQEAQRTSSDGGHILDYGVADPSKLPLSRLIDLYAVAVCLDLRPPPFKLRSALYVRLRKSPPSLADIQYVTSHLPLKEDVVTRVMTSFVRKRVPKAKAYSKVQRDQIEAYLNYTDDDLYYRFAEIERHQEEKRKVKQRTMGAAKLEEALAGGRGGVNGVAGSSDNGKAAAEDPTPAEAADEAKNNGSGRRRNRRKIEGNGKGVDGKGVPGP